MSVEIIDPKVTLLGTTNTNHWYDPYGTDQSIGGMPLDAIVTHADSLVEFAGRSCYQSFHKPNPATEANEDYIANILRQKHESVLEHATATFYIEGVSRALTHELIRHRHLSYSQLSQRFVDEGRRAIVAPPAFRDNPDLVFDLKGEAYTAFNNYEYYVDILREQGLPRKQAREAARAILPNCTETKIVVTGNMRAWRDMLGKRLDPSADAEIREVSQMLLDELRKIAPNCFRDFA